MLVDILGPSPHTDMERLKLEDEDFLPAGMKDWNKRESSEWWFYFSVIYHLYFGDINGEFAWNRNKIKANVSNQSIMPALQAESFEFCHKQLLPAFAGKCALCVLLMWQVSYRSNQREKRLTFLLTFWISIDRTKKLIWKMNRAQLFIGRLPKEVRKSELEQIFGRYGRVTRCDVRIGKF